MSERTVRLGDLIDFSNGKSRPDEVGGHFPVYGSNGIIGAAGRTNAGPGSSVIGRVGSYCGSVYYSTGQSWVTDNAIIARARDKNDPRYCHYLLKSLDLHRHRIGSGQPLLTQAILNEITAPCHEPVAQATIGALLGALDDKIGVNVRIAQTIQQLAETHYKAAASAGRGWSERPLGEVASVTMGQSPPGKDCNRTGEGRPLLNGPTEFGSYSPRAAQWTTISTRVCERGDLLLCVRGSTTGRLNWADQEYVIGRGLAAIRARRSAEETSLVYFALLAGMPDLLAMATGSVFPNLSRATVETFRLRWPNDDSLFSLVRLLSSLADLISRTEKENETLVHLRDTLLPGLMSGVFRVRDAEKVVEDAT